MDKAIISTLSRQYHAGNTKVPKIYIVLRKSFIHEYFIQKKIMKYINIYDTWNF